MRRDRSQKIEVAKYKAAREMLKELKAAEKIQESELLELSENIRQQQNRLYKQSLNWIYEVITGSVSVLEEVKRELSEGDLLLSEGLKIYRNEVSAAKYEEVLKSIPGTDPEEIRYRENSISTLLNTLKAHKDYLEQDSLRKWLDIV